MALHLYNPKNLPCIPTSYITIVLPMYEHTMSVTVDSSYKVATLQHSFQ